MYAAMPTKKLAGRVHNLAGADAVIEDMTDTAEVLRLVADAPADQT